MEDRISRMLGLGGSGASSLALADRIQAGLPYRSLERLKEKLQVDDGPFSAALGISVKTMGRIRSQRRRLDLRTGDRLYRLARVFSLACEVFGAERPAREWLQTSQAGLGDRVPLDLLRTEAGGREVEDLLGRIEYGVYS